MKCTETTQLFDDYLQGSLSKQVHHQLKDHLAGCASCQRELQDHKDYLQSMASFETPKLDSGRAANLLRNAALQGQLEASAKDRKSSFVQGFIAASVMALAVSFGIKQFNGQQAVTDQTYVANYGVDAQEIALVINAPFDMDGAQLILNLPADVSIQGQEHLATVEWAVDLKKGSNRIVLPVQFEPFAEFAEELMLSASLIYQDGQKDFEVDLTQDASSEQSHGSAQSEEPQRQHHV